MGQNASAEAVAGFDEARILGLEGAGLMLRSCQSCVFRKQSMSIKSIDVANFSNNPSGVNETNAGYGD